MTPSDGPERAYVFSVIERTSIKWYHEIFRKYVEGVTGLKPRVRFAPPSAEVSYAFGVPPENAQLQSFFYAKQIRAGRYRAVF